MAEIFHKQWLYIEVISYTVWDSSDFSFPSHMVLIHRLNVYLHFAFWQMLEGINIFPEDISALCLIVNDSYRAFKVAKSP